MKKSNSSQSGVALLMALGILALLSILGAAFSTNMRLMERTTRDFVYDMQARYLAGAGVEYAIAELKEDARDRFVYDGIGTDDKFSLTNIELPEGTLATIEINVIDTARQININNANTNLLEGFYDVGIKKVGKITTFRSKHPFITKKELKLCGIDKKYDEMEDSFTIWGYEDPNSNKRSAVNINTAIYNTPEENHPLVVVLEKILGRTKAKGVSSQFISYIKKNGPFKNWTEFDDFVDNNLANITPNQKKKIKDNANPNRSKPSGNTTEFCFHSGGTYELESKATITKNNRLLAQKSITTTIKIFGLCNMTTKDQFSVTQTDSINTQTNYKRVTWDDTCPVRSDDNWNGEPTSEKKYSKSEEYYIIPNSIKMGYWDGFEENKNGSWGNKQANQTNFNGKADMPQWGEIILGWDPDTKKFDGEWGFVNFSVTIKATESDNPKDIWNGNRWNGGTWDKVEPYTIKDNAREVGFLKLVLDNGSDDVNCAQWYVEKKRETPEGPPIEYDPPCVPFFYNFTGGTGDKIVANKFDEIEYKEGKNTKCYRIIQKGKDVNIYAIYDDDTTKLQDSDITTSLTRQSDEKSWIKLYTETWVDVDDHGGTHWDNLRLIPDTCWYMSPWMSNEELKLFTKLGYNIEWCNLWATVTILEPLEPPKTQDVKFQTVTTFWKDIPGAGEVDTVRNNDGSYNIKSAKGEDIQWKAVFKTEDPDILKTPILEDVWITYLPKTKILYWREGEEE